MGGIYCVEETKKIASSIHHHGKVVSIPIQISIRRYKMSTKCCLKGTEFTHCSPKLLDLVTNMEKPQMAYIYIYIYIFFFYY